MTLNHYDTYIVTSTPHGTIRLSAQCGSVVENVGAIALCTKLHSGDTITHISAGSNARSRGVGRGQVSSNRKNTSIGSIDPATFVVPARREAGGQRGDAVSGRWTSSPPYRECGGGDNTVVLVQVETERL
jgi:hypothetical protein